jgi:hypothetical protein
MRSNRVRLGMLAVVALLVPPCSALARTTSSTDAAIAELRQLVRQLRGEVSGQSSVALITGGIGGNVSGVLVPRWDADDRVKFAANAGSGIGHYITDLSSLGGQDAAYDLVQISLRALPVSSGYFGMSTPGRGSSPRQ